MPAGQAVERLPRIDDVEDVVPLAPLDPMEDDYYESIVMMPDPMPEISEILRGDARAQELLTKMQALRGGQKDLLPEVARGLKELALANPHLLEQLKAYSKAKFDAGISETN
jgi:hypothetical protein